MAGFKIMFADCSSLAKIRPVRDVSAVSSGRIKGNKPNCIAYMRKINGDNLNNIRFEVSRHFRIKKREYLNYKNNELATNSKNKIVDSSEVLGSRTLSTRYSKN
jgi:hypothetical protein